MAVGMERLRFMIGTWDIEPYTMGEDGKWIASPPNQTTVTALYDGTFLQEHVTTWIGDTMFHSFVMWSYDKFRQLFRMIACEHVDGMIEIFEGNIAGETMSVSNVNTTAVVKEDGRKQCLRLLSTKTSTDCFIDELQVSSDGGQSWSPLYRATHTRKQ